MTPRKWFPRIIGEDNANYLVTSTNYKEARESTPKWLAKASAPAHLIPAWHALRAAMLQRIEALRHEAYTPYLGADKVALYFSDNTLMMYVDINPPVRSIAREMQKYAHSPSWTVAPFVCGESRPSTASPAPRTPSIASPPPSPASAATNAVTVNCTPIAQATVPAMRSLEARPHGALVCDDPLGAERPPHHHEDVFECTSYHHFGAQRAHSTSCKVCARTALSAFRAQSSSENEIVEFDAALPICKECANASHADLERGGRACRCLEEKCSSCLRCAVDDLEVARDCMAFATDYGELCLGCLGPVGGFAGARKCANCGGVTICSSK